MNSVNRDVQFLQQHELIQFNIDDQVQTKRDYEEQAIIGYVSSIVLHRNGILYEITPENVEEVGYRTQLLPASVIELV